jgi:hypothetical protein
MKRRKRIIWWESGVAGRPGTSRSQVPQYEEWARQHVDGFVAPTTEPTTEQWPHEPRLAGPTPIRLQTLGEALTLSMTEHSHSVPQAAATLGATAEQFIEWALDRADTGPTYDAAVMTYLGVDYYTLRGLVLRSQMRRVQLRIHQLPA